MFSGFFTIFCDGRCNASLTPLGKRKIFSPQKTSKNLETTSDFVQKSQNAKKNRNNRKNRESKRSSDSLDIKILLNYNI